jgi:hypothetical protein
MLERALDLGCPYVSNETGTYNQDSDWVWRYGDSASGSA